jgi:glycosyltransferase involved in cell wall biosynthesis
VVLRSRSLGRAEKSLRVEWADLANRFGKRAGEPSLVPDLYRPGDPLVLAYWPLARTNNFQGLLYSQGWRHGVAPFPVGEFEDMAALPWDGPMACHFHWLASIEDKDAVRRFEAVLKRLKDRKRTIVWTVHNVLPHDTADIATAVRVRRTMVEAADLIHVMSERTPELVEPYFSLAGKRVFHSPHPSYLGDYPGTVSREQARFELGLRPETTVFLSFGAIRPYKGIEELIAAAQALEQNRPDLDWALVIVGAAKDEELVSRIRRNKALNRRLIFHPHKVPVEDVQYLFRAADYAVCAYRSSLNSGAAMLALSFGVPLVAPETAAFSELLARGAGIRYSPDEPRALTAALVKAIDTDPAGMSGRAASLAEERTPRDASNLFFERLAEGLRSRSNPA